nr:MAG TPA: hypothetical protein [Caudoviricetes sp.]
MPEGRYRSHLFISISRCKKDNRYFIFSLLSLAIEIMKSYDVFNIKRSLSCLIY